MTLTADTRYIPNNLQPTTLTDAEINKYISNELPTVFQNANVQDLTVYTGITGILLTLTFIYKNIKNLHLDSSINISDFVRNTYNSLSGIDFNRSAQSFLLGSLGYYSTSLYIEKELEIDNEANVKKVESIFNSIRKNRDNLPAELLYGKSGVLYAIAFLNKHLSQKYPQFALENQKTLIQTLIERIFADADKYKTKDWELMWEWNGTKYLGAAHGVCGILTTLISFDAYLTDIQRSRILKTIDKLIDDFSNQKTLGSSVGRTQDLYQFCHGSPGLGLLLTTAFKAYQNQQYITVAKMVGDLMWEKCILKKGVGLCHGISGNAFYYLALWDADKSSGVYYEKACALARYSSNWDSLTKQGVLRMPDHEYSLFEGVCGYLWLLVSLEIRDCGFPCCFDAYF